MKTTFTRNSARAFRLGLLSAALVAISPAQLDAQPLTITQSPTTVFSDNSGDWGVSNPEAVETHDNNMAHATATAVLLTGHTDFLKSWGYNMNIPNRMTIKGIQVDIEKSAFGINVLAWVNDYRIRMMKNGTLVGSNYAKSGVWPVSDQYYTYGGRTDLWGTTWTVAEVNAPNFGVGFSAEINGILSLLPTANLDHMRITVSYQNMTLPIQLINFKGEVLGNKDVKLSWSASGENANSKFAVQRSTDGSTWSTIQTISVDATGINKDYTYSDPAVRADRVYYRIATLNEGLATKYSEVISIRNGSPVTFNLYPNPASSSVTLESADKIGRVHCFNAMGLLQPVIIESSSDNLVRINIASLSIGIYYLQANGQMIKFIRK